MNEKRGCGKIEGQQSNKKKCNRKGRVCQSWVDQPKILHPPKEILLGESNTRDGEKTGVGTNLLSLMPSPNHNSFPPLWVSESPRQWVVAGSEKDRTENPISNIVNTNIDINIIIIINVNINNININSISIDLSKWNIFAYLPVLDICRLWSDLGPKKGNSFWSQGLVWSHSREQNV